MVVAPTSGEHAPPASTWANPAHGIWHRPGGDAPLAMNAMPAEKVDGEWVDLAAADREVGKGEEEEEVAAQEKGFDGQEEKGKRRQPIRRRIGRSRRESRRKGVGRIRRAKRGGGESIERNGCRNRGLPRNTAEACFQQRFQRVALIQKYRVQSFSPAHPFKQDLA